MDGLTENLVAARTAYAGNRWAEARAGFLAARALAPLAAQDMAALAEAAWWEGAIDESLSAYEEAYRLYLHGERPDPRPAAMLAMDIGFSWYLRGEEAMGSGWLGRDQRLLEGEPACVEHAYLQSLQIDAALGRGDFDTAIEVARAVGARAAGYGDETLMADALVGEGVALIKQGRVGDGLAVLDEAMLPVVAGRVRPAHAGSIYCQLMTVCHDLADLRRAQQWTDATTRWCQGFSSAVMFLGICRVHRAQLLQVRGEWAQAEREIQLVCEELAAMNVVAIGLALYELAEVRRLRGDLTGAAEAYVEAHRHGRDPHPGLALLWLAQDDHRAALEALRDAESTIDDRLAKTRLWEAMVEVAVAAGDLATARRARDELDAAAATYASSGLVAAAALARGQVAVAEGDAAGAIESLQAARQWWQDLAAPYRVAQVRVQLATAYQQLGNEQAAALERAAADATFARLGVVSREPLRQPDSPAVLPGGLTPREAEVLALVARGMTNREVAGVLVLSEKTVARHLANLYTKLDVGSRTAAAAYAHAHGLTTPLTPPPA
jgi:DNA-binding NarL/FixJ family response regulator